MLLMLLMPLRACNTSCVVWVCEKRYFSSTHAYVYGYDCDYDNDYDYGYNHVCVYHDDLSYVQAMHEAQS